MYNSVRKSRFFRLGGKGKAMRYKKGNLWVINLKNVGSGRKFGVGSGEFGVNRGPQPAETGRFIAVLTPDSKLKLKKSPCPRFLPYFP